MERDPIRFVRRANAVLRSITRINMGIEYPVRFLSKVSDEGDVHGDFMPKLLEYRNEIRKRANMKRSIEWGRLGPASYKLITRIYQ